jgi:hypothetical protein
MVQTPSRRDLLRSGATLTALTSLAGCADLLNNVGAGESSRSLGPVPDGVGFVTTVDADAVRDDDATETVVDNWLAGLARREYASDDQPASYDETLDRFADELGLDPTAISSFTPFFDLGGLYGFGFSGYGTLVAADWSADEIADSLEASTDRSYEEDEHYGQPLYSPDAERYYGTSVWLGVLGDGRFVVGAEGAVRETIEASLGETEALDGRMEEAHAATRDGPIRFVLDLPLDVIPNEIERDGTTVPLEPLNEVATVAGAVYGSGDTRGIEVTMACDDGDTAEDLTDTIDGFTAFLEPQIDREELATALDEVSVSQDGSNVILRYENAVEDIAATVGALAGPSEDERRRTRGIPAVAFEFDYDSSRDTVEITHSGGDNVRATDLSIRGTGFADAARADMTGPGQWRGSASGEMGGESAVVAGDRVAVGVESDYELRVVWMSDDGDQSATLAADEGPDA